MKERGEVSQPNKSRKFARVEQLEVILLRLCNSRYFLLPDCVFEIPLKIVSKAHTFKIWKIGSKMSSSPPLGQFNGQFAGKYLKGCQIKRIFCDVVDKYFMYLAYAARLPTTYNLSFWLSQCFCFV